MPKDDDHPDEFVQQAIACHRAGHPRDARALYDRALAVDPDHPRAVHYLGLLMIEQGEPRAGFELIRRSVELAPGAGEFWNNLGAALGRLGRLDEAAAALDQAARLAPESRKPNVNRGLLLRKRRRPDDAAEASDRARRLPGGPRVGPTSDGGDGAGRASPFRVAPPGPPDDLRPTAPTARGDRLRQAGKLEQAVDEFRADVWRRPDDPVAWSNLGTALRDLGRLDESAAALRRAIDLRPDHAPARFNLSTVLLARGDYERGWLEYEWRRGLASDDAARRSAPPHPEWNGAPLAGLRVLLRAEQGLGDTIQFARYAPLVAARGGRVILQCQPPLARLMRTLDGVEAVAPADRPPPPFDLQARLPSLPGLFGTRGETVPAAVPYLRADPARADRWARDHLAPLGGGLTVGIVWQGNRRFAGDRVRSIPLTAFAPLASVPGVRLVSLQKGDARRQLAGFRPASGGAAADVADLGGLTADDTLDDTAAVIDRLDVVVTSDTSVAHLAGALGRPVWVALSAVPDWRWLLDRDDSPWYPTMRLFRQRRLGEWAAAFDDLAAALRALAASRPAPVPRAAAAAAPHP